MRISNKRSIKFNAKILSKKRVQSRRHCQNAHNLQKNFKVQTATYAPTPEQSVLGASWMAPEW